MVGDGLSCVVGDFGMSRALAKDDSYYYMTTTNKLPVKWMALEAIEYKKYSTYSDGELRALHASSVCVCVCVCVCPQSSFSHNPRYLLSAYHH